MLLRSRGVWFSIVVAVVALTGCTTAPQFVPVGRVSVPAQPDSNRPVATVRLSNEVVINLPAVKTAGNVWTIVLNDARFLHQLHPLTMRPDGTGSVSFMAIRQGRRPIRFYAVPPGREVTPTQAYEILLTIE